MYNVTKKEKEFVINIKKIVKNAGGGQKEYKQIQSAFLKTIKSMYAKKEAK